MYIFYNSIQFKPFTKCAKSDEQLWSFHAGGPVQFLRLIGVFYHCDASNSVFPGNFLEPQHAKCPGRQQIVLVLGGLELKN